MATRIETGAGFSISTPGAACDIGSAVATVCHGRDAALVEAFAELRAVTVRQGVVKDGSGQPVGLNRSQRLFKSIGNADAGAAFFKLGRDIEGNGRFILNDENCASEK